MKKISLVLIMFIFVMGCKETGIHYIDNPDGTSAKIYYWAGNNDDNQPNIIKIGNRGQYMEVKHNATFMTDYNTQLNFELKNGQSVVFECNNYQQKIDYNGEAAMDWEGNPTYECLKHIVTSSTVPAIKIGATASFGI